jgi:RNA 3'-terminal phosphate cyclase-like protein
VNLILHYTTYSETGNTASMGQRVAFALLDEVKKGGTVDTTHQSLALMLMMLCPEDISKIRLGKLSKYSIACLRLFRDVFGVVFHVRADESGVSPTLLVSVRGIGYKNIARVAA